ncbi:divergent protein kinase domain 1B-like [Gigantopelta aegis]|uniref:divergent protein kinase domain 1B-like n=1 Tax=Gigantopelta aegis TaxID=1735272 RepID=UPI001B8893D0|nr:divergent protein kinase domain 1B-like [Gigantopelta aegis]
MRRRKKTRSLLGIILEKTLNIVKQCENLTNEAIILCAAGVVFVFVFAFAIWRITLSDPCDGSNIYHSLCQQYQAGEIAGRLCYTMCLEQEDLFSYCLDDDGNTKTFLYDQSIVRVNYTLISHGDPDLSLQEGTTVLELRERMNVYLLQTQGHSSIDLLLRLLEFSDFNHDEKISLGEAQSIWQLIHIPEFLYYFIFQKSLVFPHLNATCGSMYAFQYTPHINLFDKTKTSWFKKVFTNSYKWNLPAWPRRAKLSVGLLEFVMDIYEEYDNRYLMCDIGPDQFGYTKNHDLLVADVSGIVSMKKVEWYLRNLTCGSDSQCMYSKQCFSQCDVDAGQCSGKVVRPGLWFVCDMLQDYILFDAPRYLYFDLKRLLNRCASLDARRDGIDIEHAILQEDFKSVLWNEIVNSPLI